MSYSFNVRADTKAHAVDMVRARMRQVVEQQPAHNMDGLRVVTTAKTFIGMLEDDDARDVRVSMDGSISITENGVQQVVSNIFVNLQNRPKEDA